MATTELELITMINNVDSELEIIRTKIKLIKEEWDHAQTILCKLNLDRKNLKEELRQYKNSFVSKEITERQIEINEFRSRMEDALKKV